MAPRGRGRPRKVAFDAMKGYGFTDELIKSTIEELLEVYMDEWKFIEDSSYRVLLENILEKVEKQAKDNEKEDSLLRDNGGVLPAGSSVVAPGPTHTNREVSAIELRQQTVADVLAVLENAKPTEGSGKVCNANAEGVGRRGKDTNSEQDCNKNNRTNNVIQGKEDGSSSAAGEVGKSRSHCPSEFGIGPEKEEAANAFPSHRRRPYYGLIRDSDEPLELIELKPTRASFAELLSGKKVSNNRKRRWDVKPEDIREL